MSDIESKYWHIAKDIFNQALELPAADVPAFLAEACKDDPELLEFVSETLDDYHDVSSQTIVPATAELHELVTDDVISPGHFFGKFSIIELMAKGGIGHVYLAERTDKSVQQKVAIKVIRKQLLNEQSRLRFHNEQRILTSLDHSGIVQLIDTGEQQDFYYYVMEYVDGSTLNHYCATNQLPLKQRLKLFKDICDIVAYAHANLIVHRDLKPQNIMVTDRGEVKLLDFGIAKPLSEYRGSVELTQTAVSEKALTPNYAAPEQFFAGNISTACDIYALGALLYELLTNCPPLDYHNKSWREIEDTIQHQVPDKPSDKIMKMKASFNASEFGLNQAKQLADKLKGEMDSIILTCLKKEPHKRYKNVAALSDDLYRIENHQPISVQAHHTLYKMNKFLRRNWLMTASLSLIFFISVIAVFNINRQKNAALKEQMISQQVTNFLIKTFTSADPSISLGTNIPVKQVLEQGVKDIKTGINDERIKNRLLAIISKVYFQLGDYATSEDLIKNIDLLTDEHQYNAELLLLKSEILGVNEHNKQAIELLTQAEQFVTPEDDFTAQIWQSKANRYKNLDYIEHAMNYSLKAKALAKKNHGPESFQFAIALRNHARMIGSLGDAQTSIELYEQALSIMRKSHPDHHPQVAQTLKHLTISYRREKMYERSLKLAHTTYDAYVKTYGNDHVIIATVENLLGTVYKSVKNYSNAAPHLEKAYEILVNHLGPDASKTAIPLFNLASMYHLNLQKTSKSLPYFKEAVRIAKINWGETHNNYHYMQLGYAKALIALEKYQLAEEKIRSSLAFFEKQVSHSQVNLAVARSYMAHILMVKNLNEEALKIIELSLPVLQDKLLADNPDLMNAQNNYNKLINTYTKVD